MSLAILDESFVFFALFALFATLRLCEKCLCFLAILDQSLVFSAGRPRSLRVKGLGRG